MTDNNNEYEEMEKAVESAFNEATDNILAEAGIHRIDKLELIRLVFAIEMIQILDSIVKERKDWSKDYIDGFLHARAEVKNRFTKGLQEKE